MLLAKRALGALLTFFSAFVLVVGVGRTTSAGSAAPPLQLPIILLMVFLFGAAGLWLILSQNRARK